MTNYNAKNIFGLSNRELEVAELIAEGYSNKEIACFLCIETSSVKQHIRNIYEKLQIPRKDKTCSSVHRVLAALKLLEAFGRLKQKVIKS